MALTSILIRRDHQGEAIALLAERIGHVLQRHEVAVYEDCTHFVSGTSAGQIHLRVANRYVAIVDLRSEERIEFYHSMNFARFLNLSSGLLTYLKIVVTIQLQILESEHEPLQHRFGGECDHAVQVLLPARRDHRSVDQFR